MINTSLGLHKPEDTDNADLLVFVGQNMDTINTLISGKADSSHIGSGGTSHAEVTTIVNGFMIAADKSKLDGIAFNANNYIHPANHPASIITQDASNRFVTDTEKTSWNAKLDANANAVSSSKFATGRTIALTGDAIGTSGTFDGSANLSFATTLKNTGTAGTYTKVTTDTQGRVSSGTTLLASDIPNLDWAKVTSGKPTTLSGYGITDTIKAAIGITAPSTPVTNDIWIDLN